MPSSGYTAITFVAGEQPTTAKWNLIGSNDSSFNLGTGLEDNVILDRHLLTGNLKANKFANPYKFNAYRTAAQNTVNGFTNVLHDTELYDSNNNFDVTTNKGRYTVPINGFYHFDAMIGMVAATVTAIACIYKNGTVFSYGTRSTTSTANPFVTISKDMQLVAGDFIEIYIYCSAVIALEIVSPNYAENWFNGHLISST